MDKERIKNILKSECGYSDYEATVTATDLCNIHPQLQSALSAWVDSRIETNVSVSGFSTVSLMKKKGVSYPAALIALDWIIEDPKTAIADLSSNIKRQ